MKFTCSMVPAPPSPWTTSMLLMVWGKSFGIRLLESRIRALKMREGAIGHVNSCVKLVTPMFWENMKAMVFENCGDLHQFAVLIDWVLGSMCLAWIHKRGINWRFNLLPLRLLTKHALMHMPHGRLDLRNQGTHPMSAMARATLTWSQYGQKF